MLSSRRYLRYTMRYLHDYKTVKTGDGCLRLCQSQRYDIKSRMIRTSCISLATTEPERNEENDTGISDELRRKLIYCEYLDGRKMKFGYSKYRIMEETKQRKERARNYIRLAESPVYSVALENMLKLKETQLSKEDIQISEHEPPQKPVQMPYSGTDKYDTTEISVSDIEEAHSIDAQNPDGLNTEYKVLYEKYLESSAAKSLSSTDRYRVFTESLDLESDFQLADDISKVPPNWMTDYDQYDDNPDEDDWEPSYGTSQPNSEVSSVPCGGCGALLHCKDTAIPGYLPSELFLGKTNDDLNSMICQRCHFMENYNTSLAVNVSAEEYPKLLASIKSKKAAVILLIDLMDFPCSIWPDILSIIGTKRPVFVVGNKVDLLPQDSQNFLKHATECLSKAIVETGINKANIKDVALISAKTGFGIEQLINKLHNIWEYKGHVYLIGCTNSGKSTLFNVFLQSDYCKSQAVDFIRRATTSPWPGTTLNLLKFPILRPSQWRLSERAKRLKGEQAFLHAKEKFRQEKLHETKNLQYSQFIGQVGRTFGTQEPVEAQDLYSIGPRIGPSRKKMGLDISTDDYRDSHWCYDTPGTVQPDQVLHLLTTDELMLTLPKKMIIPRTFCIKPKQTLFLGGLGRVDYFDGDLFIRVTVFASEKLPITVCLNEDASFVYDKLLTTEAFSVPVNDPERLKHWPELRSKDFEITGIGWDVSAADIVLSSAGWFAVTPGPQRKAHLRAWTPEGRGIHLRTPALLQYSVGLRGKKVRDTPGYYRGVPVYRRP